MYPILTSPAYWIFCLTMTWWIWSSRLSGRTSVYGPVTSSVKSRTSAGRRPGMKIRITGKSGFTLFPPLPQSGWPLIRRTGETVVWRSFPVPIRTTMPNTQTWTRQKTPFHNKRSTSMSVRPCILNWNPISVWYTMLAFFTVPTPIPVTEGGAGIP